MLCFLAMLGRANGKVGFCSSDLWINSATITMPLLQGSVGGAGSGVLAVANRYVLDVTGDPLAAHLHQYMVTVSHIAVSQDGKGCCT